LHADLLWVKERAERGVYQKLRLKVAGDESDSEKLWEWWWWSR